MIAAISSQSTSSSPGRSRNTPTQFENVPPCRRRRGRTVQVRCSPAPPVRPVAEGTTATCGHHRDGHRGSSTAVAIPGPRSTARRDSNAPSPPAGRGQCVESPPAQTAPCRTVWRQPRANPSRGGTASDNCQSDPRTGRRRRAGGRGRVALGYSTLLSDAAVSASRRACRPSRWDRTDGGRGAH